MWQGPRRIHFAPIALYRKALRAALGAAQALSCPETYGYANMYPYEGVPFRSRTYQQAVSAEALKGGLRYDIQGHRHHTTCPAFTGRD